VGTLLLAFALRLAWMVWVRDMPGKAMADPAFYDAAARALAAGKGYLHLGGQPTAEWPPGYPLLLAGIYKVFGHSIALVKLVNALAGAGTCLLAYLIARRTFNAAVGFAAALVLALFPSQIFWSTLVMTEVLSAFLVALLIYVVITFTLDSISWRRVLLVGLLLGVMSLIRGETVLLFVPLAVVWAVAHRSIRRGLGYGLLACVTTALVIFPWAVRNWISLGYPVPISTGSADNLLAGHWDGANGMGSFTPGLEVSADYAALPNPDREVAVYKAETRRALSFMLHNPRRELELIPEKLFHFYREDSGPLVWIQTPPASLSKTAAARLRDAANSYYLAAGIAALLAIPLWFSLRDPRKLLLALVLLYYSILFGFVFIGEQRFHSALIPIFAILSAVFLVWLGKEVRRRLSPDRAVAPVSDEEPPPTQTRPAVGEP
jgi:4-amino-4-deoxy-L-arabinose transferase-like glycosyltransferase